MGIKKSGANSFLKIHDKTGHQCHNGLLLDSGLHSKTSTVKFKKQREKKNKQFMTIENSIINPMNKDTLNGYKTKKILNGIGKNDNINKMEIETKDLNYLSPCKLKLQSKYANSDKRDQILNSFSFSTKFKDIKSEAINISDKGNLDIKLIKETNGTDLKCKKLKKKKKKTTNLICKQNELLVNKNSVKNKNDLISKINSEVINISDKCNLDSNLIKVTNSVALKGKKLKRKKKKTASIICKQNELLVNKKSRKKKNNTKISNNESCSGSLQNIISHLDSLQSGTLSKKRKKKIISKLQLEKQLYNSSNNTIQVSNTLPGKILSNSTSPNKPSQNKNNLILKQVQLKKGNQQAPSIGNISLPIYEVKQNLLKFVLSNETSILIGETGCGKSTQVPQFLYEFGLHNNGLICITQPRKIAAISLAKRVAQEMGTDIGETVGYAVRFDEKISGRTKLKYVTDGMLLREALSDPLLNKYVWIILDEAHERTVNTDILFGIVKKAQKIRKLKGKRPLRIIIMSATMDVDRFIGYFGNADAKVIEGRQHEIGYSFVSTSQKDYNLMCLSVLLKLHESLPVKFGFLVFLTGQDEIELFVKRINKINEEKQFSNSPGIEAFPLYAQLPDHEQAKVFKTPFSQKRKVIVSTNIAETSLTLPGISVVIDSCHFKTRFQNPNTGFEELRVEKISIAQAFQRAGRAGREGPGFYYSILTKEEFEGLRENPIPEILKSELSSTYVTLLGAGVQNVLKFDFFDRPPLKNLRLAEVDLRDLKIVSGHGETVTLTDLGRSIKYLPLKPQFGKILLTSAEFGCSEEILTIISLLSCESIYINPSGKQEEAKFKRRRFHAIEGDHITLLNVYDAYKATTNTKAWCHKNYINFRNLDYAANIRAQLAELCDKKKIPIISCQINKDPYKVNREPILKALISGLFKNVARRQPRGKYKCLITDQEVFIHPGSLLFGSGSEFIMFTSVTSTGKQYMNQNSIIDPQWLKEVCPDYFRNIDLPFVQNIYSFVS